ncbi:hypothetical protein GNP44_03340 [Aliivibrio fischeri]|nr:hypothetical protein [Aliivibrio fischeri]
MFKKEVLRCSKKLAPQLHKGAIKMKKSDEPTLTHMILLQQFNYRALIPVEELAEPYLNLARRTALNRAKTHSLPFPCFSDQ